MNFRRERLNRGFSLDQLAKEIGVSKRVLQALEQGGVPYPRNQLKIAQFYGCEVTDLWPPNDEAPRDEVAA